MQAVLTGWLAVAHKWCTCKPRLISLVGWRGSLPASCLAGWLAGWLALRQGVPQGSRFLRARLPDRFPQQLFLVYMGVKGVHVASQCRERSCTHMSSARVIIYA
jgi:hypothetical protein